MAVAVVCASSLQLIHCLNYLLEHFDGEDVDLFMINQFSGAEELRNKILKTGIFRQVYLIADRRKDGLNAFQKLREYWIERFCERLALSRWVGGGFDINKKDYTSVVGSGFPTFFLIMAKYLQDKRGIRAVLIEDGLGSYLNRGLYGKKNLAGRILSPIFELKAESLDAQALYVNSPELSSSAIAPLRPLSKSAYKEGGQLNHIIDDLFEASAENYRGKKVIYFNQPLELYGLISSDNVEAVVVENIRCIFESEAIAVKIHQRVNAVPSYFPRELVIGDRNPWELTCAKIDAESMILISPCSAALFTPFMMYGKETRIILTYKLYGGELRIPPDMEEFIGKVKGLYPDGGYISIPNDMDEFTRALRKFETLN